MDRRFLDLAISGDRKHAPFRRRLDGGKTHILRKYLPAYTTALKKQPFKLMYIDAFAGTGTRKQSQQRPSVFFGERAESEEKKGSARLALEVDPPFHQYVFIDKKRKHIEALESLKREFPSRAMTILRGDANQEIKQICAATNWRSTRAVLFLDPYGMQVEWATLEAAAKTKAIDVWVLFPSGMGLNRLITRRGRIPKTWEQTLDRFLGVPTWRQSFYREVRSVDLFDGSRVGRQKDADTGKFETFFLDRLRSVFGGVVPRGYPLVNRRRQVMYLLCFACANPRAAAMAVRIAESVMKVKR